VTQIAPAPDREPLTRDEIVAAAIALMDEEGLDRFSMRRLGQRLGAGATSLYWHVRNKDEIVDLVIDELIGEVVDEVDPELGRDIPWRDQLAAVARVLRRVLLRHRHIAPLLGERPTIGPRALDAAERVIGILRDAGFDDRSASLASGALINYASGFALFESRSPGGSEEAPEARAQAEAVMAYFRSLPIERYPNLLAVAGIDISGDDQFEYGLQRMLDGLAGDLSTGASHDDAGAPPPDTEGPGGGNVMLIR
jgi:AcrR family transcriptional regulator